MRKLLGLLLFLSVGFSQINDKNFKSEINGGVTGCRIYIRVARTTI